MEQQPDLFPECAGTEERQCAICPTIFHTPRDTGARPFAYKPFCPRCEESVVYHATIIWRSNRKKLRADPKPPSKQRLKRPVSLASAPEAPKPEEQPPSEPDTAMTAAADALLRGENPLGKES